MDLIEIERAFDNYLMRAHIMKDAKEILQKLLAEESLAREVCVKKLDNYSFRKIVHDFHLDLRYVQTRERLEQDILKNHEKYTCETVQQALCDVLFHDNKQNVMLKIKTLQERASLSTEFNKTLKRYNIFYDKILEFLSLDESASKDVLKDMIHELSKMNKTLFENESCFEVLIRMYDKAEKDFQTELETTINESGNTMLDGIEPEIVECESQQVQVYKMQNQTKNQAKFKFLARTMYVGTLLNGDVVENYISYAKSNSYFSFSLSAVFNSNCILGILLI